MPKPISRLMEAFLILVFFAGVCALAYGAWLAWKPAGFLVAGFFGVLVPIFYARGSWDSSTG